MKIFIALIAMVAFFASAASARNAHDLLRDEIAFCSQFVIIDPEPTVVLEFMRECCAYSRNIRDCRMYEWEVWSKGPIGR
jgi:hypothetical protein